MSSDLTRNGYRLFSAEVDFAAGGSFSDWKSFSDAIGAKSKHPEDAEAWWTRTEARGETDAGLVPWFAADAHYHPPGEEAHWSLRLTHRPAAEETTDQGASAAYPAILERFCEMWPAPSTVTLLRARSTFYVDGEEWRSPLATPRSKPLTADGDVVRRASPVMLRWEVDPPVPDVDQFVQLFPPTRRILILGTESSDLEIKMEAELFDSLQERLWLAIKRVVQPRR